MPTEREPLFHRSCWLRGRRHGPFVEYDPPYVGTRYVFPHYRCESCGHRVSLLMGAFMRPRAER